MQKNRTASFKALALTMICLLLPVGESRAAQQTAQDTASRMKQIVANLGAGTDVMIEIGYREAVRGVIRTIGDSGFDIDVRGQRSSKRVDYGTISMLKLPTMKYRVGKSQDTAALRKIISAVGVGKDVVVKTTESAKFRATIQTIDASSFSVSTSKEPVSHLEFSQVSELEPAGLGRGRKAIAIGALAGAVALLLILAARNALANS